MIRIGIDTGGTFTDLVMVGDPGDRHFRVHKVRSTPDDPARAILQGLGEIAGGRRPGEVVHGSTVATNAVLERKGARVALVATAGFEDVLGIGRQTRRELYNLMVEDRRPLVDPALTFPLVERLDAGGEVIVPIDSTELDALVRALGARSVDAVAVCLLHSYANPAHEAQVADRLSRAGLTVTTSHQVLREYREFERWSTTVLNAYVTPLMTRYLDRLEQSLGDCRLRIMQSNGGSISAAAARTAAVHTVLSGPAAGVVGAQAVARAAGWTRVISFDMGGTSTDVSLIDGRIQTTTDSMVGDLPLRLPVIDIHTVGAGGGSIASVDAGGSIGVGPESAGADPGPVCYGVGTALTVTDANLLLGRLDPAYFLGGRMTLDLARAREVGHAFAARLGMSIATLAEGIIRIANANMDRAIRVVSIQRGFDPRDFALVAFGGAGGMHACDIAEMLGIPVVIAPRHAGVLSALGTLLADVTRDSSESVLRPTDEVPRQALVRRFDALAARARRELGGEGFRGSRLRLERALDLRYVGQSYEIAVPFQRDFRAEFDRRHARLYGYADPRRPTEIVNVRLKAIGVTDKPALPRLMRGRRRRAPVEDTRPATFGGRAARTAFYHRDDLLPGMFGPGPAVLTGAEATTVIPPGFQFRIDDFGNVIATRRGGR